MTDEIKVSYESDLEILHDLSIPGLPNYFVMGSYINDPSTLASTYMKTHSGSSLLGKSPSKERIAILMQYVPDSFYTAMVSEYLRLHKGSLIDLVLLLYVRDDSMSLISSSMRQEIYDTILDVAALDHTCQLLMLRLGIDPEEMLMSRKQKIKQSSTVERKCCSIL